MRWELSKHGHFPHQQHQTKREKPHIARERIVAVWMKIGPIELEIGWTASGTTTEEGLLGETESDSLNHYVHETWNSKGEGVVVVH
mmetsp:Transcript_18529/g.29859  ORF Transcript_18529/g.29859 Transcript_18529/m.29859 type:complete len:86 (-) Transcript_18529:68-325(-)